MVKSGKVRLVLRRDTLHGRRRFWRHKYNIEVGGTIFVTLDWLWCHTWMPLVTCYIIEISFSDIHLLFIILFYPSLLFLILIYIILHI